MKIIYDDEITNDKFVELNDKEYCTLFLKVDSYFSNAKVNDLFDENDGNKTSGTYEDLEIKNVPFGNKIYTAYVKCDWNATRSGAYFIPGDGYTTQDEGSDGTIDDYSFTIKEVELEDNTDCYIAKFN